MRTGAAWNHLLDVERWDGNKVCLLRVFVYSSVEFFSPFPGLALLVALNLKEKPDGSAFD